MNFNRLKKLTFFVIKFAIAALIVYLFWAKPKNRWVCASLAMIVGGGVGNMIDRVRLGYVIDFFDFCAFPQLWKWIFNVADAFVCVGGAILFVACVVSLITDSAKGKSKGKEKATAAAVASEQVSAEEGTAHGAEPISEEPVRTSDTSDTSNTSDTSDTKE